MNTFSLQITPALLIDEDNEDDQSGAGPTFGGAGTSPKTRSSLIGSIFGNRMCPLARKKQYFPPATPPTTPICSPRLGPDNDSSVKRRGSVASPRLGEKFKGLFNGRRGSCIENPLKSSLPINYETDINSPYFVPISPSRSPFTPSLKYNHKRSEFRIFEDLGELDLESESESDFSYQSTESKGYKNETSFDESLARVVDKMTQEGYSEEQINTEIEKAREKKQDAFRPKTPTPAWHNRLIDSINRSLGLELESNSLHHLFQDEPKGNPKNPLDLFPTEVFRSEKFRKDDPKCTICLSAYTEGELMKSLPCFHCFHTDCIEQWFKVSCCCPICKFAPI